MERVTGARARASVVPGNDSRDARFCGALVARCACAHGRDAPVRIRAMIDARARGGFMVFAPALAGWRARCQRFRSSVACQKPWNAHTNVCGWLAYRFVRPCCGYISKVCSIMDALFK